MSHNKNEKMIAMLVDLLSSSLVVILYIFNSKLLCSSSFLAFSIIFFSIWISYKLRKNNLLLLIFSIIAVINISAAYTDIFRGGLSVAIWQIPLRMTNYAMDTAQSLLLFLVILNICFNINIIRKFLEKVSFTMDRKENILLSIGCSILLIAIIVFGYDSSSAGEYVSNSNVMIEYSGLVFLMGFYYSKNLKYYDYFSVFYVFLFLYNSLIRGDRSAASIILILYVILYFPRLLKIGKIVILSLIAILGSNFIGIVRDLSSVDDSILSDFFSKGLYIDTVSYAYYTSITFSAFYRIVGNSVYYLKQFIISIFIGTSKSDFASFSKYIRDYDSFFFNRDGGFLSSWFFSWGGNLSVVLFTVLFGIIIILIFRMKNDYCKILSISIAAYSLRWYLYNPINFFRVNLLILSLLYILFYLVHRIMNRDGQD